MSDGNLRTRLRTGETPDAPVRFRRNATGGFRLEAEDHVLAEVEPAGRSWQVRRPGAERWASLARQTEPGRAGRFRIEVESDPALSGRVFPRPGTGQGPDMRYLLWGDGRLFRLAPLGIRAVHFELLGWEAPGPYIIARPESGGWSVEITAAGDGLRETLALSVLIAAEILDLETPLGAAESS